MSNDAKVRASAEDALVQRAGRSLPLLRRFMNSGDEDLQRETFEIIRRIGPPAIPLLVELLRHRQVEIRRLAADALIDLAPDTVWIQPALRRSLRDEDSMVVADSARALGALRSRASPSVRALVNALRTRNHTCAFTQQRPSRPSDPPRARRLRTLPERCAIRFPAFAGLQVRPSEASVPPRSLLCRSWIEALKDKFLYVLRGLERSGAAHKEIYPSELQSTAAQQTARLDRCFQRGPPGHNAGNRITQIPPGKVLSRRAGGGSDGREGLCCVNANVCLCAYEEHFTRARTEGLALLRDHTRALSARCATTVETLVSQRASQRWLNPNCIGCEVRSKHQR